MDTNTSAKFDKSWSAVSEVASCDRSEVNTFITKHYLQKWPGVVVAVLAMRVYGVPVGCCVFALGPREISKRYGGPTWELARLYCLDFMPCNTESFFIGQAIRWVRRNKRNEVSYLVSYADPSRGHTGLIYRATNWTYDGMTDAGRKTPRKDYRDKTTGKMYSRKAHVPEDAEVELVPRVSKHRFYLRV